MTDPAQSQARTGAPAGAVDEFAHIPRRRARHPLITLAGALLAFFLVFYGCRDLRYALSSGEPLELGARPRLFSRDKATADLENRYVRVAGTPDRESALELDTKGSWVFSQLFRVLGTGDRLFVHRLQNPLPAARAEADVFEGRLIRVDELPYADAIRALLRQARDARRTSSRPMRAGRRWPVARPGAPLALADRGGDTVALAADEALAIEVVKPDEVQIGLPRARFPTKTAARAAIDRARRRGDRGAGPGQGAPRRRRRAPANLLASAPQPPARWTFVVRFPAGAPAGRAGRAGRHRSHGRDPRRARDDRDAASRAGGGDGALLVPRRPAAPNAAAGRRATSRPCARSRRCVIPDGRVPADRGRSPARSPGERHHRAGADDFGVFNVVGLATSRRLATR